MNFWTLFRFECKKLFRKKLVWACLAVMVVMSVLTGWLSNRSYHSFDGIEISSEEYQRLTQESQLALAGRTIDETLMQEMLESKRIVDSMQLNSYEDVESFLLGHQGYVDVNTWVKQILGEVPESLTATQVYDARIALQEEIWEEAGLSEGEKDWWRKQESQVEKPFVYDKTSTWENLSGIIYSINIMGILMLGVCLPGIFSDEHTRRTDQLNLAAPFGRKLCSVKLLVGALFGFGSFILFLVCGAVPAVLVYGTEGFQAAVQLMLPDYAMKLTMGQLVLIMSGLLLASSVVCSIFAMVMAEVLHSGIAATALMVAVVLAADMLPIPYSVRWLEEVVSYLPSQLVTAWEVLDVRLFPWFGTYLTPWQAGPILWAVAAVLLTLLGRRAYCRYQISGR